MRVLSGLRGRLMAWVSVVAVVIILGAAPQSFAQDDARDLAEQVNQLVRDLESDRLEDRDAAEKQLIDLAGDTLASGDRLLDLLPPLNPQLPPGLQTRLGRVRRKVDQKLAKSVVMGSKLTLDAKAMPLAEVLKSIEEQTGNRVVDYRSDFGQESPPIEVDLTVKDEPFWQVMDKLLDATGLSIYNFAEDGGGLALVARTPDTATRVGSATYVGPFRIEATQVVASHDFRRPSNDGLQVHLEFAWEPRLKPILLSHPLSSVFAADPNSQALSVSHPEQSQDVEVQSGSQATELALPFALSERTVPSIAVLRGELQVLMPGRVVKFEFDKLDQSKPQTQQRAGVAVTLDRTKREGDILEVHMRVRLEKPGEALASHRSWVFQNPSYLLNEDGDQIDNAGFETILQNETEVGIVYLFDVPEGEAFTWVYETPAAIVEMPVAYELRDIKLP